MKKDNKKLIIIGIIAAAVIAAVLFFVLNSGIKVTFDSDNQQPLTTVKVEKGQTVTAPTDPVKEGYAFNGWKLNGEPFDFSAPIEKSITLKADYIKTYQVTFMNEEKEVDRRTVKEGDTVYAEISLPILEDKDNYFYVGWTLDGQDYDLSQPVKSDLILKAKWEKRIYIQSIALKNNEITLDLNQTAKIEYTLTPEDATEQAKFTSKDESIVHVDELGNLTPRAVGSTAITLSTEQCSAEMKINVVVLVQKVTLDKTSYSMKVGEKAKLNAAVSPESATDKTITFISSDDTIVNVDKEGNIQANAMGKATITATSTNGLSASCEITVEAIEVASVSMNKTSVLLARGSSLALSTTISPSDATNKTITYTSSHPEVATVGADGKVSAIGKGTTTIVATSANGKTATCDVEVFVKVDSISITVDRNTIAYDGVKQAVITVTSISPSDADATTIYWNTTGNVGGQNGSYSIDSSSNTATITARDNSRSDKTCSIYAYVQNPDGTETKSNTIQLQAEATLTVNKRTSDGTWKYNEYNDGKYRGFFNHMDNVELVANNLIEVTYNLDEYSKDDYISQEYYEDKEVWLTLTNEHSHQEGFNMTLTTPGGQTVTCIISINNAH